jgi:hypothetical protein
MAAMQCSPHHSIPSSLWGGSLRFTHVQVKVNAETSWQQLVQQERCGAPMPADTGSQKDHCITTAAARQSASFEADASWCDVTFQPHLIAM